MLVPVVYLCPETLSQLANGDISKGTASIAAGNSLSVDATAINNVNGTLSSKGDVTLKSKGILTTSAMRQMLASRRAVTSQ